VRQFVKGTDGPWAGKFASALCGSPELFGRAEADPDDWWGTHAGARWRGGRGPGASVNFVTAHDGFTLADLVAYNEKQNAENGEGGRDGEDHNLSWNCGAEGPTADRGALLLRERQQRNLACALLLAQGVPMVVMGDEYGHSKGGNNNTYCHDSPLNWFQWDALEARDGDFGRFFRHLVHFRRSRAQFRNTAFLDDAQVQWHGEAPGAPDWSDASRLVAFTLAAQGDSPELYVAFNAGHEAALLALPGPGEVLEWRPVADTSRPAPLDFLVPDEYLSASDAAAACAAAAAQTRLGSCAVAPRSCVILEAAEAEPVAPPGVLRGGVSEPAQPYVPGEAKGAGATATPASRVQEREGPGAGKGRDEAKAEDELRRMMEENQRLREELGKRRQ